MYLHIPNSRLTMHSGTVRKFIEALKGDMFTKESLEAFLEAFRVLIRCNITGEVLRSLALFITYALQEGRVNFDRTFRSKHPASQVSSRSSTPPTILESQLGELQLGSVAVRGLGSSELAFRVLQVCDELLCDQRNEQNIRKLAKTVTSKVRAVVLRLRFTNIQ